MAIPAVRLVSERPWLSGLIFRFDRWGDSLSDEAIRNPYPLMDRIRADGPVVHHPVYNQWFVTGYDEAKSVLSSPSTGLRGQLDVLLSVRPYSQLSPRAKDFMAHWLLFTDPPDHGRLRRLVSKAFTPARVRKLEPSVEELTDRFLDGLPRSGPFEVIEPFCSRLPVAVIGRMLGLPEERWEWSGRTTAEFVKLLSPFESFDPTEVSAAVDDVFDYYAALGRERATNPRDDLITALVQAEDGGDRLTSTELVSMIAFLMGAGHETTTNLLSLGLHHLASHPDQRAMLVGEPDRWPNAVEELIRFDTSVKAAVRTALVDIDVGGVTIPAGSNILIELVAANRDPRRFERPNELIVDRADPAPLSFGHGAHHCLGHALARTEARVGLQRFVERYPGYLVDGSSEVWRRSSVIRGLSRLVVVG